MPNLALVTDSSADLPDDVSRDAGVLVARGKVAFTEHTYRDGDLSAGEFYARMEGGDRPQPSSPTDDDFMAAFEVGLERAASVACLVTPFDMVPSFTAANAGALGLSGKPIKVINAGLASAGLGALLTVLATEAEARAWEMPSFLDAVDELVPRSDSVFVAADPRWLDSAGRLALIEEKVGILDGRLPVVRAGTRLTGLEAASSFEEALDHAVTYAGRRAGEGTPLVVTVDHAANPDGAALAEERVRARWKVERVIVAELSATYGSQLGPGAVGLGITPASV